MDLVEQTMTTFLKYHQKVFMMNKNPMFLANLLVNFFRVKFLANYREKEILENYSKCKWKSFSKKRDSIEL